MESNAGRQGTVRWYGSLIIGMKVVEERRWGGVLALVIVESMCINIWIGCFTIHRRAFSEIESASIFGSLCSENMIINMKHFLKFLNL